MWQTCANVMEIDKLCEILKNIMTPLIKHRYKCYIDISSVSSHFSSIMRYLAGDQKNNIKHATIENIESIR